MQLFSFKEKKITSLWLHVSKGATITDHQPENTLKPALKLQLLKFCDISDIHFTGFRVE